MHRRLEMKRENDTLVIKILKLRGIKNNSQKSMRNTMASYRGSKEEKENSIMKRSGSARSIYSERKK